MLSSGYKARHSVKPSQEKPDGWPRHASEVQVPRQAAAHEQAGTRIHAAVPMPAVTAGNGTSSRGGATRLRPTARASSADASRVQITIIIGLAVALVVIVTFFATPR